MALGCVLAFIAGIGLPGLAFFVGHLVDGSKRNITGRLFDKKIYRTMGAMEGIAIATCLLSLIAWSTLDKFAQQVT